MTLPKLDAWSQNTEGNPLLQLHKRFSEPIFSALRMRMRYASTPWWSPTVRYGYVLLRTPAAGEVYIPQKTLDAFQAALKRGGTDIHSCLRSAERPEHLKKFNKWLLFANHAQLTADSTDHQIKKAYHAASLVLHPDKLDKNQQLRERLSSEGITDINEPSKDLNELYAKLCPVDQ